MQVRWCDVARRNPNGRHFVDTQLWFIRPSVNSKCYLVSQFSWCYNINFIRMQTGHKGLVTDFNDTVVDIVLSALPAQKAAYFRERLCLCIQERSQHKAMELNGDMCLCCSTKTKSLSLYTIQNLTKIYSNITFKYISSSM